MDECKMENVTEREKAGVCRGLNTCRQMHWEGRYSLSLEATASLEETGMWGCRHWWFDINGYTAAVR